MNNPNVSVKVVNNILNIKTQYKGFRQNVDIIIANIVHIEKVEESYNSTFYIKITLIYNKILSICFLEYDEFEYVYDEIFNCINV